MYIKHQNIFVVYPLELRMLYAKQYCALISALSCNATFMSDLNARGVTITPQNNNPTNGDSVTLSCTGGNFLDPSPVGGENKTFTCVETDGDSYTRKQEWDPSSPNIANYQCTGWFSSSNTDFHAFHLML